MSARLSAEAVEGGFRLTAREESRGILRRSVRVMPFEEWVDNGLPPTAASRIAVRNAMRDGLAQVTPDGALLLDEDAAVRLDAVEADGLGLPPTLRQTMTVETQGNIASDDFRARVRFVGQDGRPVTVRRHGATATVGERVFRLPAIMRDVARAVEAVGAAATRDDRLAALGALRSLLPDERRDDVRPDAFLRNIRLRHAHTLTLDVRHDGGSIDFDPVPLGAPPQAGEPDMLLGERELKGFQADFRRRGAVPVYVLPDGSYLFTDPSLRRTLAVVHAKQRAPIEERVAFALEPERVLADEAPREPRLPDDDGGTAFAETARYSERVAQIGPWVPPDLPFIKTATNTWLPECFAVLLGEQLVTLRPDDVPGALAAVRTALENGEPSALVGGLAVAATAAVEATLRCLEAVASPPDDAPPADRDESGPATGTDGPRVLVVKSNHVDIDYRREVRARDLAEAEPALTSTLRPHQVEALAWLRQSYAVGRPGVLLADDMGLGKTIEVLAFLSWWRRATSAARPILVVAPTSLLDNWTREHDHHLAEPLGTQLTAYGPGLKRLRGATGREEDAGKALLDITALASAGFVLTTYETLRDYQFSFAAVDFAIAVFDETQKVKNPKSRLTNAAKSLKADFSIAMTGTPVENHMADLWSICDLIQPGSLGPLRDFIAVHDPASGDIAPFEVLRAALLDPSADGLPPLVLRRLKGDVMTLPPLTERPIERKMAGVQAEAYQNLVVRAQAGVANRLRLLHDLRSISLHPFERFDDAAMTAADYIAASARLAETIGILDRVRAEGAKALVFLDARRMQDVLSDLIAERYAVRAPDIVSGQTPARSRQAFVDVFTAAPGFAVLILSPRAAGVGLNIVAATHVIHLDRWWNPAVEDQCTARAYRIGQTREVTVHLPMALHPGIGEASYDAVLNVILARKRRMSQHLFMPAELSAGDFAGAVDGTDGDEPADVGGFAEDGAPFDHGDGVLARIDGRGPEHLEDWVARTCTAAGLTASRTRRTGDGGVDVIVQTADGAITHLIQCKHTRNVARPVGVESGILSDESRARTRWQAPDARFVALTNARGFSREVVEALGSRQAVIVARAELTGLPGLLAQTAPA